MQNRGRKERKREVGKSGRYLDYIPRLTSVADISLEDWMRLVL